MRVLLLLLISFTCYCKTITPLDSVLSGKVPVSSATNKRVSKAREGLVKMACYGSGGLDIPLLLTKSEADSIRATPIYIADMSILDKDILAMYVHYKGKSVILLGAEILNYDDDEFTDIIVHEYVHQIDMLLGKRLTNTLCLRQDTIYSKYVSFHKQVLRGKLMNPNSYIKQIDDIIMLSSGLHSKSFFEFSNSKTAMLKDMMYVVPNIWSSNDYYTSDIEVFTRYVLLKRWLVMNHQIDDIYAPISKDNVLFILAYFPLIHDKNSCFNRNIMKQNFYPLLFFIDLSKLEITQ